MNKWQPIESAPKDLITDGFASRYGQRILVYPVHGGMIAGARWFQSKMTPEAVGFVSDWQEVCEPDWWMPLPEPPALTGETTNDRPPNETDKSRAVSVVWEAPQSLRTQTT